MIGTKRLDDIRAELHQALLSNIDDPIDWLESRMSLPRQSTASESEHDEVIVSLQRFLAGPKAAASPKRRCGAKKK